MKQLTGRVPEQPPPDRRLLVTHIPHFKLYCKKS
jgi:hypothetical protein